MGNNQFYNKEGEGITSGFPTFVPLPLSHFRIFILSFLPHFQFSIFN
jgi:hypothetical protein